VEALIPSALELAVAADRWLLYMTMLLASGSAMVLIALALPPSARAATQAQGRIAGSLAAIAYVLAIGLGGADALGSAAGLIGGEAWTAGAQTTLLASAALGIAAMTALALGFSGVRAALGVGIVLAIGSFLVTGHGATLAPRVVVDIAFVLHLFGAAFWLAALWPLAVTVRTTSPRAAGEVMARFSRQAATWVVAIVASGLVVAWIQLRTPLALIASAYGVRLLVKLGLVAALLAIALHNKLVLTPALARDDARAAKRLRGHIAVELALFALILAAAVSLTLVASPAELAD
jgi:copper transport protein